MSHLYIVLALLIWSSLGVLVRIAELPVHVLLFYATLCSLFFQSLLFLEKHFRKAVPPLRKIPFIFLLSVCLLLNTFTFLFAYAKTSIANAVFTHYIAPIVVAFLAVIFLKEKITWRVVISIVLSSIGLWIMLGGITVLECIQSVFSEGIHLTSDLVGIISGLASGVAYAVLIILARVFTQRFHPYMIVFIQNSFIVLMLLPFVRTFPIEKIWIFVLMGALHSTLAPFLYYRGLRYVKANSAAILGYLEPVGAIVFSIILLSEWPDAEAILGGMFIIAAGYLTITQRG